MSARMTALFAAFASAGAVALSACVGPNPHAPKPGEFSTALAMTTEWVRPEHLEECKRDIESRSHILGGPWRLTEPLRPSVNWYCAYMRASIGGGQKPDECSVYAAPAQAGTWRMDFGCLFRRQSGRVAVTLRTAPSGHKQDYCHHAR